MVKVVILGEFVFLIDLLLLCVLVMFDEIEVVLLGNWRKWTRLDVVCGCVELEIV